MTNDELVELMVAVEERFPVDRWRVDGVHVWPLVRYDLGTRNIDVLRQANGRTAALSRLERARRRLLPLRHWARARAGDRVHEDRLRPADLLLYSDGAAFVRLGAAWYDRFCDPIADAARGRGVSSLIVTPTLDQCFAPRHRRSVLIQPAIDAANYWSALRTRIAGPLARRSTVELESYDSAVEWMRARCGSDLIAPSAAFVERMIVYMRAFAAVYRPILRAVRPRAVFVVCYYGAERMAMLLAARWLGIPTVDIQHGVTGRAHWAYSRWTRVPREGYELLPTWFWCWNQSDVDVVEEWSGREASAPHRALHVGNLYLERWKSGQAEYAGECAARIDAITARHGSAKQVLFTANGLETPDAVRALASAVAATRGERFWSIRMHPSRLAAGQGFAEALAAAGCDNWNVDDASALPLYALLGAVDVHVTEVSSTVIEAAEFRVPSVLSSKAEVSLFASLVASGWALAVDGWPGVPAAIARQLVERTRLPAPAGPPGLGFDGMLDAIVPSEREKTAQYG